MVADKAIICRTAVCSLCKSVCRQAGACQTFQPLSIILRPLYVSAYCHVSLPAKSFVSNILPNFHQRHICTFTIGESIEFLVLVRTTCGAFIKAQTSRAKIEVKNLHHNMAPKQNSPSSKEVKPPRELPKMEPKKPLSEIVGTVFAVLGLAALASSVSQLNLSPVYGSIPAAIYHQKGITFTAMLAYVAKKGFKKSNVTIEPRSWIAPWAYYIPVIQFLLFRYSSDLGPLYGPLITEAVTYFPLLFLSFLTTSILLDDFGLSGVGTTISEATPMVISYAAFTAMDTGFKSILPDMMGTSDFFSRSGLQLLIATLSAVLSKSSLLFFAIPAVLHTLFTNPHNYAVGTTRILNQTLAEYRYSILDRHDSNTGYISVVENLKDGYRALRCDHSVLGGEWQITPARAQSGQIVKETIYSVFTMLEAVRMIKSDIVVPDDERDALFM